MSSLVPFLVTTAVAIIGIAAQFYGRLVPLETQKAHLVRLGRGARISLNIAVVILLLAELLYSIMVPRPLTAGIVAEIAWDVCGTVGFSILLLLDKMEKITGRLIDLQDHHLERFNRHLGLQKEAVKISIANRKAILLLIGELREINPETQTQLDKILSLPEQSEEEENHRLFK